MRSNVKFIGFKLELSNEPVEWIRFKNFRTIHLFFRAMNVAQKYPSRTRVRSNSIRRYANFRHLATFSLWFTEYQLCRPLSRVLGFAEVCGFWRANALYSTIVAVVPVNSRLHSQYRVLSRQVCEYTFAQHRDGLGYAR